MSGARPFRMVARMPDDVPRDMRHLCKQFPGTRTFIPSNPREGGRCSLYAASERPVPAATSAGSYSVPTSRVGRKFTAWAASRSRGTLRVVPGEPGTVTREVPSADGTGTGRSGAGGAGRQSAGLALDRGPESSGGLAGHARRAERPAAKAWAKQPRPGLRGGLPMQIAQCR